MATAASPPLAPPPARPRPRGAGVCAHPAFGSGGGRSSPGRGPRRYSEWPDPRCLRPRPAHGVPSGLEPSDPGRGACARGTWGEVQPRRTSPRAPRQDGGPAAEVPGATGRKNPEAFLGQITLARHQAGLVLTSSASIWSMVIWALHSF
ncbi:translation initiation factor IF-2-like [Zalophus californianus]|uniref:Translation initiation factor IF-2-like n=1 Tax=Zalophus californianus TaxID=9704 RepID=A0A6J2DMD0_ZALCA|nr:translation initiation factor IF-2-like [Zalophus californianus]